MNSIPFIFDASKVPLMEYEIESPPMLPSLLNLPTVGGLKPSYEDTIKDFFARQDVAYTTRPDHYTPLQDAVITIECDEEDIKQHRAFLLSHCPYAQSYRFVPRGQGMIAGSEAGSSFHNRFGGARISPEKQALFIPFLEGELAKGPAKITDLVERGKAAGIAEASYHGFYQALHLFGAEKVRGTAGQGREIWWSLPGSKVLHPQSIEALATGILQEKPHQLAELRTRIVSARGKDISPKRLRLVLEGLGAKEIPAGERGRLPLWRLETSVERAALQEVPEVYQAGAQAVAAEISKIRGGQTAPEQLSFLDPVGQMLPGLQPEYSWKDEEEQ